MEKHRVCIGTDVIIDFLREKSPGQEILEECIDISVKFAIIVDIWGDKRLYW